MFERLPEEANLSVFLFDYYICDTVMGSSPDADEGIFCTVGKKGNTYHIHILMSYHIMRHYKNKIV